ncbi:GGDEF-domain containing protein [Porphyrobacter sp. HT-58-2]|uniref:putative bifunctional diguanylate cyclase/phosphodiesterase n=1 Tax=Porphyrobacter sp. HT-58-2 TaxID=2023229 RepID=UPI000CDCD7F2|nr:EAL domain-containing protein [Porphyrobacter sp. HT-58-2]AUX69566.1 GGDEF-domain containing protein [Porphyrobacter sp. HT-58-2]
MRAFFQLFDLDTSDPELMRAQFRSFQGHIPLLYGILVCNTVAITVTSFNAALLIETLVAPIVISTIAIVRAIWWLRQGDAQNLSDLEISRHLKRTCQLAVIMTLTFNAWVIWVYQDAGAYARSNLTFFLALSQVSTVFCLMTLRAAAMMVSVVSTIAFALYFSWIEGGQLLPQSLVLCCVCIGMAVVTHSFNRSFSEVVQSRRTLHIRQLETEKLSEENRRIAFIDPLSGLPNRRELLARLDRLEQDEGLLPKTLAIVFIDLDGFKQVNDEHGHQAGDELIRIVCERLRQQCPDNAILARVGGDEFTVLLETDEQTQNAQAAALTLAFRLLEQMALPVLVDRHVLQISGSIGIATNTDAKVRPRELLRRADLAMYHAKTEGKGQVAIYSDELDEGRLRRIEIEGQIGAGLTSGEFDVVYQPIIDAASGTIVSAEALLRWPRRTQGPLSPDEFIEVAEATGQIHPLGLYVLERACRELRPLGDLCVSVNVSPAQFRHPGFERQVLSILERTGFPPERLQLEMTESYLLANPGLAIKAIGTLKAAGIALALDDFGTGFTSIHYLKSYGFTHIKLDKSLLQGLEPGSKAAMLVAGAITLATALEMSVIAEGVEHEAQASVLRDLGCQEMQGFLFGRPESLAKLKSLLKDAGNEQQRARRVQPVQ